MIDVLKQQFKDGMGPLQKENLTREFLQILCLKIMGDKGAFDNIAFIGGTSLRILFGLRRFSEDLDFSLIEPQGYDIQALAEQLVKAFQLYGIRVEAKVKDEKTIHQVMLKFEGLLREVGLSPLASQKLSIKLETDIRPPEGWVLARSVLDKGMLLRITHYEIASLFAGKLHAFFCRKYTKGRDLYDLIWYISRRVRPNFVLLNNAYQQTEGQSLDMSEHNFQTILFEKLDQTDFETVKRDVERFLEDPSELQLFDAGLIKDAFRSSYGGVNAWRSGSL